MLIIMAAAAFFETRTIVFWTVFLVICKIITYRRKKQLELRYDHSNELFKEFIAKSEISKMEYEPYIFAPTPGLQGFVYLLMETFYENIRPEKFNRELIKLPDGGTIGLDWDGEIPDPENPGS